MSGRFRLDPRDAREERTAAQPPPTLRAQEASPPAAPVPAGRYLPAGPGRGNRRALTLAAVVVALLVLGAAVGVYVATAAGYPDKYLLEPREYPPGMSKARLSADDMDDLGIRSNPGKIDDANLDDFETSGGEPPDEGHALVLADAGGARVIVLALQYATEEDAMDFAKQARALCSFAGGIVLRDGTVLVGVLAEDGASRAQARAVADALRDKADDLVTVC